MTPTKREQLERELQEANGMVFTWREVVKRLTAEIEKLDAAEWSQAHNLIAGDHLLLTSTFLDHLHTRKLDPIQITRWAGAKLYSVHQIEPKSNTVAIIAGHPRTGRFILSLVPVSIVEDMRAAYLRENNMTPRGLNERRN